MGDTTVEDGTSSNTAIERCPARPALANNAAPSTVTASARRSNPLAGSRTCVRPQPRQPTQGQPNNPVRRSCSTAAASSPR